MTDQPADNYIKPKHAVCTCCQKPFKFTKKRNDDIMMQEARILQKSEIHMIDENDQHTYKIEWVDIDWVW